MNEEEKRRRKMRSMRKKRRRMRTFIFTNFKSYFNLEICFEILASLYNQPNVVNVYESRIFFIDPLICTISFLFIIRF